MSHSDHWRQFSQATLDLQYNARATVPDIEAELQAYRDTSLPMYAQLACARGLHYGDHADETLDLFPVPQQPNAPLFVFIHGGYWRALHSQDSVFMAQHLVSQGIAVASVNYTLAPAASLSHIVEQCEKALGWLHHHGAEHGVAASQAIVAGSSAGAHLAAMLMTPQVLQRQHMTNNWLVGGILVSGLFDLAPIQRTLPNQWLNLSDDEVHRLSPMHHLPVPNMQLHIAVAEKDTDEFKRQSLDYAHACQQQSNAVVHYEVANTNHFNIILDWMRSDTRLSQSVMQLLQRPA